MKPFIDVFFASAKGNIRYKACLVKAICPV